MFVLQWFEKCPFLFCFLEVNVQLCIQDFSSVNVCYNSSGSYLSLEFSLWKFFVFLFFLTNSISSVDRGLVRLFFLSGLWSVLSFKEFVHSKLAKFIETDYLQYSFVILWSSRESVVWYHFSFLILVIYVSTFFLIIPLEVYPFDGSSQRNSF